MKFTDVLKAHGLFDKFNTVVNHVRKDLKGDKKLNFAQWQIDHDFILDLEEGEKDVIDELITKKKSETPPIHWVTKDENPFLGHAEATCKEFFDKHKMFTLNADMIGSSFIDDEKSCHFLRIGELIEKATGFDADKREFLNEKATVEECKAWFEQEVKKYK